MAKPGPSRQMIKRIMIIMLSVIIATVSVTSFRLVTIMLVRGREYQSKASAQQLHDAYIAAERGNIYDTNMNVLAKSATVWTIYVTPNDLTRLSEKERVTVKNVIADNLSSILSVEREEIIEKLEKTSRYYVEIKKKVSEDVADKVREFLKANKDLKLSNYVGIDEATTRYYSENIASTVLGFVGDDN